MLKYTNQFEYLNETSEKLFPLFIKYRNVNYNNFVKNVNKEMNKKYSEEDLRRYINYVLRNKSVSKGVLMNDIFNYVMSNNNDKELKNKIENVDMKRFYSRKEDKTEGLHNDVMNKINEEMDIVINKEDKEVSRNLLTKVKSNLKQIKPEKYVDYIIANYNIQSTDYEELEQFLQVVEYFKNNIEKRLYLLFSYDPNKDEEKIKSFYVREEDKLSKAYKDNIKKLHSWKLSKVSFLYQRYEKMYNIIKNVLDSKDIQKLDKLTSTELKDFEKEEEFLINYYRQLNTIKREQARNVLNINTLNDEKKNIINDIYIKKLMKENN